VRDLETPPAQKRIMKMESALCAVIRECNGRPSRKLLDAIQEIALAGVGLKESDNKVRSVS
jgi:hypothetical protein